MTGDADRDAAPYLASRGTPATEPKTQSGQRGRRRGLQPTMDVPLQCQRALDVSRVVSGIRFRYYTDAEVRALSVVRVQEPDGFDLMGRPVPGGLYDRLMGPSSFRDGPCATCGHGYSLCPGHFGHIELPFPAPNPLLVRVVVKLFHAACITCRAVVLSSRKQTEMLTRILFADAGATACERTTKFYYAMSDMLTKDGRDLARIALKSFREDLPEQLHKYFERVNTDVKEECDAALLKAAKHVWRRAAERNQLLQVPSEVLIDLRKSFERKRLKECPLCGEKPARLRCGKGGLVYRKMREGEVLLSPMELKNNMEMIWESAAPIFELLYGQKGRLKGGPEKSLDHNLFFLTSVAVPPNRFRPAAAIGAMETAAEHPQNLCFSRILQGIDLLAHDGVAPAMRVELTQEDLMNVDTVEISSPSPVKTKSINARTNAQKLRDVAGAVKIIQDSIYFLFDNKASEQMKAVGIRQQLEAKEGLFRMHMMGKRVNYSCRSVIGPDMFLATDEVGIPQSFASLLTIPEFVTPLNLNQMRAAVLNGPDNYPGATAIEYWTPNGQHRVTNITAKNCEALAKTLLQSHAVSARNGKARNNAEYADLEENSASMLPRRVLRHLRNNDLVLFNRQPSLHRVSIMAHKVRVLPGNRTIRFHYANCGSYNADFDGDEMNVHIPQDPLARAEAQELMLSSRHYINATSGHPIRGLIQDHIAAAALLSRRDRFMRKDKFCQLLYAATDAVTSNPAYDGTGYRIPIPAILKPEQLWSGKQLLSTVLAVLRGNKPGFHLETKSKTPDEIVGAEESRVLFRDGQLVRGTLDKSSLGATVYGAVHGVQEVYGTEVSDNFLSCLGKLGTFFLREHGHTSGIDDLTLLGEAEEDRYSILTRNLDEVAISSVNSVLKDLESDVAYAMRKAKTKKEARLLTEKMVTERGKEAEDRLDQAMKDRLGKVSSLVAKACLPHKVQKRFPKNGFGLMVYTGAKGGFPNSKQISCNLGSTVLEGKRVPRIGGSGATLPCFAPYDASPNAGGYIAGRFLTGLAPFEFFFHAMSGREGLLDTSLKTANSGYLQRCLVKHLEGVKLHYDYTVRDSDDCIIQFIYGDDGIDPMRETWLLGDRFEWQMNNMHCLPNFSSKRDADVAKLLKRRRKDSKRGVDVCSGQYPTILESLSPGVFSRTGAVSEKFRESVEKYVKENGSRKGAESFLEYRYQRSVAQPGDPVGVIAAQGIGEPSTQMTLNTFHHAGSSSAHVTLGIPRLRELVMTASKTPKTPSMTIPMLPSAGMSGADTLSQRLTYRPLSELVLSIKVEHRHLTFLEELDDMLASVVGITLVFPKPFVYEKEYGISFDVDVKDNAVDVEFLENFNKIFQKELARSHRHAGRESTLKRALLSIPKNVSAYTTRMRVKASTDDAEKEEDSGDERMQEKKDKKKKDGSESDIDSDDEMSESDADSGKESGDEMGSESSDEEKDAGDAENDLKKAMRDDAEAAMLDKKVIEAVAPLGLSQSNEAGTELTVNWVMPLDILGRIQLLDVAQKAASLSNVVCIDGLTKCFVEKSKKVIEEDEEGSAEDMVSVITEGSNIEAIFLLGGGLVDYNKLETNDMASILNVYGVEALRQALIMEFKKIFDAYGIPVNIRHLSLLADYMTVKGTYRGFNRIAINDAPSPFQKMTFETSLKFLADAALYGGRDPVRNPSAAIAVGATYEGGTGGMELLQPL